MNIINESTQRVSQRRGLGHSKLYCLEMRGNQSRITEKEQARRKEENFKRLQEESILRRE